MAFSNLLSNGRTAFLRTLKLCDKSLNSFSNMFIIGRRRRDTTISLTSLFASLKTVRENAVKFENVFENSAPKNGTLLKTKAKTALKSHRDLP